MRFVAGIISAICFVSVGNAADKPAPPPHSAMKPAPPEDESHLQRHLEINKRAKQGKVDLIFLGDSITQSWETSGQQIWERFYRKRNALNAGMSGDDTGRVLWRLDHGNVDGIKPKLAVLLIGANNITAGQHSATQIADGIDAIVRKLRERLPETKVLLLGIFPRDEKTSPHRETIAKVNQPVAQLADGKSIHFLDIGAKFLQPDGAISKDIMPDLLHLSSAGYEIWAQAIEGKVIELMDETR